MNPKIPYDAVTSPNRASISNRLLLAPLVAAVILAACGNDTRDPSLPLTTPSTLESETPSTAIPSTVETRYIPPDPATTRATGEQTTRTTHQPEATESTSPESQNASEYIRSGERREVIDSYFEYLNGQFTELLEQNPDKVRFNNFTTGEITQGIENANSTGWLEIRFAEDTEEEETIYVVVNQDLGDGARLGERMVGYGVRIGTEEDPSEQHSLTLDPSPTGDRFSGNAMAAFMFRAQAPGLAEIRGSTYDFQITPSTKDDVAELDLNTRLAISAAMQRHLVPDPKTVITGQIVHDESTTTQG